VLWVLVVGIDDDVCFWLSCSTWNDSSTNGVLYRQQQKLVKVANALPSGTRRSSGLLVSLGERLFCCGAFQLNW